MENIYDFEKEPDFARLLKKYSIDKKNYMDVNKTEMIYIPDSQSSEIWDRCWRSKVDNYIKNLQFFFCTGEWSTDKSKRRYVESRFLCDYKQYYAKKIGLPRLKKDNDRISIGKIHNFDPDDRILVKHIGCVEKVPERLLQSL